MTKYLISLACVALLSACGYKPLSDADREALHKSWEPVHRTNAASGTNQGIVNCWTASGMTTCTK